MTLPLTAVTMTVTPDASGRALLDVACRQLCCDTGLGADAADRLCRALADALPEAGPRASEWCVTFDCTDGHLRLALQGQVIAEE
ncbi:MAG: hypothetical protein FJW29_08725 [Acidobacteria bacterium]|nr:hypothetical protein [Acidobacteriota bacterium]